MFHVEQFITEWLAARGCPPSPEKAAKLASYAEMVHDASSRFNLTGFKSIEEITVHLVLESLEPLLPLSVPRGTLAADMGSGAGVPGIPLSIYHDHFDFLLIESHEKKASFLKKAIGDLSINNATVLHGRAEDIGHDPGYRESRDYLFARAFSSTYITLELSLPIIRVGGILYIFAHDTFTTSPGSELITHLHSLGGYPLSDEEKSQIKLPMQGYAFKKISRTPARFPRRYAAIKRDSSLLSD